MICSQRPATTVSFLDLNHSTTSPLYQGPVDRRSPVAELRILTTTSCRTRRVCTARHRATTVVHITHLVHTTLTQHRVLHSCTHTAPRIRRIARTRLRTVQHAQRSSHKHVRVFAFHRASTATAQNDRASTATIKRPTRQLQSPQQPTRHARRQQQLAATARSSKPHHAATALTSSPHLAVTTLRS